MAITTLDGIIANALPAQGFLKIGTTMEAAGVLHSLLYATGLPGAGAAPAPGIAGAALTTYAGQIPVPAPVGGETSYLSSVSLSSSVVGKLQLVDRVWHNSGVVVTTTTAQTINSVAWPARDMDASTNGRGIIVGIEVRTATTNASAVTNTTLSYTNSAGTAGQTATIASFPATSVAGTFVPFQLAAGDIGVRSIQSVTLGTSYGAGAIHLVAYRVLAEIPITLANAGVVLDPMALGFPTLLDNTVLCPLWLASATTAVTLAGTLSYAQG